MRISVRGKYAIMMLVDIAENGKIGRVTLTEISERQNISKKYLEQIVSMLSKAGIVRANRGSHGGYMMNVPPCKCTVGDVLRATEGELLPVDEAVNPADETLQFLWAEMHEAFAKYIDSVTLEDIVNRKNESIFYSI